MFDKNKLEQLKQDNSQKILIIDGTNNLIRAVSVALNYKLSPFGLFLKIIGNIITQFKPALCYIVFDGLGGNVAKRTLFPLYKMNRTSVSKIQTEDYLNLFLMLKYTPIITIRLNGVLGDDVVGHIAMKNERLGNKVVICSADKDFYQLCSPTTQVWDPIKKILITGDIVLKKYNCHPINFPIYKALLGDSSDNIPGIKGIGLKTIEKYFPNLLNNLEPIQGSLLNFKEYIDNMPHSDMKLKILNEFDKLKAFYKIVDLRNGCFLTPQIGSIVELTINNKQRTLLFNKSKFLIECKKYGIPSDDLCRIFPSLHLISKR